MKVLIIGLGSIAQKHLFALNQIPYRFEYFALRSSKNAPHIENITNIYHWNQLPDAIDFAIISTPTYQHVAAIEACIKKNIPIFIEKPVSNTLAGLEDLSKEIEKNKLLTYVACNLRFLPVLSFLKEEFSKKNKLINEVSVYCGSYLPNWRPNKDFRATYSAHEAQGGGVHLDLFHELDYLCWILGMPTSAYGIRRNVSSLAIDASDYAHYLLFYEHFTATATLNYYRTDTKRTMEIVFDNTTWSVDLLKNEITDHRKNIIFSEKKTSIQETYLLQMNYFINALLNKKEATMNTFTESLQILKICLVNEKII